jgi:hypothetical protein
MTAHRDHSRKTGSNSASYDATTLDMARLNRYAHRVAAECKSPLTPAITRQVDKSVPSTETRRGGFLGLRSEVVRVEKLIQVTESVIGPHWVLHRTNHHIESHEGGKLVEYGEQNYWVLQGDGALLTVWDWEEYTRWPDGSSRLLKECTTRSMAEADVLRLDFADRSTESGSHGRGTKTWGNRAQGRRIRHTKGLGLSVALKFLLTGSAS